MTGPVVVLNGSAAGGKIGIVRGPDRLSRCGERVLVAFPGESFPNDLRSIAVTNLRPATDDETLALVA